MLLLVIVMLAVLNFPYFVGGFTRLLGSTGEIHCFIVAWPIRFVYKFYAFCCSKDVNVLLWRLMSVGMMSFGYR